MLLCALEASDPPTVLESGFPELPVSVAVDVADDPVTAGEVAAVAPVTSGVVEAVAPEMVLTLAVPDAPENPGVVAALVPAIAVADGVVSVFPVTWATS